MNPVGGHRLNKTVIRYSIGGIILVVIATVGALSYDAGYRIKGFSIVKAGSLSVIIPEKGASLFIGETLQRVSAGDKEEILIPQAGAGPTLVTVLKKGYLPWAKRVAVVENSHTRIFPFIVREHFEPEIIPKESKEYTALFPKLAGPQTIVKKELSTQDARTYIDGATIKTDCLSAVRVLCDVSFEAKKPVTAVSYYRGNVQALVYSTADTVTVSGVSGDISYDIYVGENLYFYEENDTLYIHDNGRIVRLAL